GWGRRSPPPSPAPSRCPGCGSPATPPTPAPRSGPRRRAARSPPGTSTTCWSRPTPRRPSPPTGSAPRPDPGPQRDGPAGPAGPRGNRRAADPGGRGARIGVPGPLPRDKDDPVPRTLAPGQRCRIHVLDVDTGEDRILHESTAVLYEAPNWTLDGAALILNGDGHLLRLDLDGGGPRRIDLDEIAPLNNDHVLDPDGVHVFVSADDGRIHRAPLAGGPAVRITEGDGRLHFLHGISPDGATLVYTAVARDPDGSWLPPDLATVPA